MNHPRSHLLTHHNIHHFVPVPLPLKKASNHRVGTKDTKVVMKHHAWPCWVRCKSVGWRCVQRQFRSVDPGYIAGSLTAKLPPWKVTTPKRNGSSSNNHFSGALFKLQGCIKGRPPFFFFFFSFFCFLHVCDWHVLSRFLLTHVPQEVCTLVLFFCVVNLVDLFVFGQIPPAGCDEFLWFQ